MCACSDISRILTAPSLMKVWQSFATLVLDIEIFSRKSSPLSSITFLQQDRSWQSHHTLFLSFRHPGWLPADLCKSPNCEAQPLTSCSSDVRLMKRRKSSPPEDTATEESTPVRRAVAHVRLSLRPRIVSPDGAEKACQDRFLFPGTH